MYASTSATTTSTSTTTVTFHAPVTSGTVGSGPGSTALALLPADQLSLEPSEVQESAGHAMPLSEAAVPVGDDQFPKLTNPLVLKILQWIERNEMVRFAVTTPRNLAMTRQTGDRLLGPVFVAQQAVRQAPSPHDLTLANQTLQGALHNVFDERARRERLNALNAQHEELITSIAALTKVAATQSVKDNKSSVEGVFLEYNANPFNAAALTAAARRMAQLGRPLAAAKLLRMHSLLQPGEGFIFRELAKVLFQARLYDQAIEAAQTGNRLCASADRAAWVQGYREHGSAEQMTTAMQQESTVIIAQAMLLWGKGWNASHVLDFDHPMTRAMIEFTIRGRAEADDALDKVRQPLERAFVYAWRGEAEFALDVIEDEEISTWQLSEFWQSPIVDPVRNDSDLNLYIERDGLAPEELEQVCSTYFWPELGAHSSEWEKKLKGNAAAAERYAAGGDPMYPASVMQTFGFLVEAERLLRCAIGLDPENCLLHSRLSGVLMQAGPERAQEALDEAQLAAILDPDLYDGDSRLGLARALLNAGDAAAALEQAQAIENKDPEAYALMAMAEHSLGNKARSDEAFQAADATARSMHVIAEVHAWRGETDDAFRALYVATTKTVFYKELWSALKRPFMNSLRSDPRWLPMMQLINMAPEQLAAIPFQVGQQPLPNNASAATQANNKNQLVQRLFVRQTIATRIQNATFKRSHMFSRGGSSALAGEVRNILQEIAKLEDHANRSNLLEQLASAVVLKCHDNGVKPPSKRKVAIDGPLFDQFQTFMRQAIASRIRPYDPKVADRMLEQLR